MPICLHTVYGSFPATTAELKLFTIWSFTENVWRSLYQSNIHFSTWKAYQCTMASVPQRLNTVSKGQGPKKHLEKLLSKRAAPRERRGVRGKQSTSPDKPRSRLELLPSNGRSQDLGNPMPSVHGCFSPRVHNDQAALSHPKHTSESIHSWKRCPATLL